MRQFLVMCALMIVSLTCFADVRVIENFSQSELGQFPSVLKTYPFQSSKAKQVYTVRMDGNRRFLHAEVAGETQTFAVQVFRKFDWNISQWPIFSWEWRAKALPVMPAGVHRDDNACGVYVTFGGYGGKAIKYIWSSDLPVGKVIESIPGRFYVVVAQSGAGHLGQWQSMTINVPEEYRRFFKKDLEKAPDGFGLLTDGDGTLSPSVCDYGNFQLR